MTPGAGAAVLTLVATRRDSPLDSRRGIVRLHPQVLAALGLVPWSTVLVHGTRVTAALVALTTPGSIPGQLLADSLVLANAGVTDGGPVQIAAAVPVPATSVQLTGPAETVAAVDPAHLRLALLGKAVTVGDRVSLLPQDLAPNGPADPLQEKRDLEAALGAAWQTIDLDVVTVTPAGPAVVSMATEVSWTGGAATVGSTTPGSSTFSLPAVDPPAPVSPPATGSQVTALPGLAGPQATLTQWLDLAFHHRALLTTLGSGPGTGVLLCGPAGSGKTSLVEAAAGAVGARIVRMWGPTLAALDPEPARAQLQQLASQADQATPAVLLVEDVEALAPRDGDAPLLPGLITVLQSAVTAGRVAVVCTTATPEAVSPQLRRPGVLDQELTIALPTLAQRADILRYATTPVPLEPDVDLADLAEHTPGFVAADLLALVREAGLRAAARQVQAPSPRVGRVDLDAALEVVRPSTLAGAGVAHTQTTLDQVGDMAEVKQALTEAVLWPLTNPDAFARLGIDAPHGVLLYGPPGCGKTFLVRALAGTGRTNVVAVKGAELLDKYVGESERAVRELFARAREAAPTVLFLDEVDALAPARGDTDDGVSDRVVAALLTELDGVEPLRNVVVIAATNRPDLVDPALLRPGRLERLVYVAPPDAAARTLILTAAAAHSPLDPQIDLSAVAAGTDGFSSADCSALIREAALTAMRRSMSAATITAADLDAARAVVKPSLDAQQMATLEAFSHRRG